MAAPVLQALLVADQIYQDQSTGKFVICGIFGTIYFQPGLDEPNPAGNTPPVEGSSGGGGGDGASSGPAGPRPVSQQLPLNRLIRAGSPSAYLSLTEIHGQRSF